MTTKKKARKAAQGKAAHVPEAITLASGSLYDATMKRREGEAVRRAGQSFGGESKRVQERRGASFPRSSRARRARGSYRRGSESTGSP
jgi:hypothetical protein